MNNDYSAPNYFLSDEQFETVVGPGDWEIHEIRPEFAAKIRSNFGSETSLCVFASGVEPPDCYDRAGNEIAGIDWVRHENKPKPGEPELNLYHFAIGAKQKNGYPVYYTGRGKTIAPHWSILDDLNVYFQDET